MRKIDRLVWAAGFSGSWYGVRIGVRANTPEALERLRPLLPHGWKYTDRPTVDMVFSFIGAAPPTRPGVRSFNVLYVDSLRIARSHEMNDVVKAFEQNLQIWGASMAPRLAFVHAGVVGWRGKAIVIPGFSHSGKSTLTAALVRAGATDWSDKSASRAHA